MPERTTGLDKQHAMLTLAMLLGRGMITPKAMAVGAQLIDHWNLKTGRCDPGQLRLAELTGLTRSSVSKATTELAEQKLFQKAINQAAGGRNAYTPNWVQFRYWFNVLELVKKRIPWDEAVAQVDKGECPNEQDGGVRASKHNPRRESKKNNPSPVRASADAAAPSQSSSLKGTRKQKRFSRGAAGRLDSLPKRHQQEALVPLGGVGKSAQRIVGENKAHERLCADLNQYRLLEVWLEVATPEQDAAARQAEMSRHGGGIEYVRDQLKAFSRVTNGQARR